MTSAVGGIDLHQDTFTVGIVDANGVEVTHESTAAGCAAAIDLLDAHGVELVGIEGSAKWGAHVAIALAAERFDACEVPPSRSAAQRRSRRLDKTDAVDAVASARALLAEPTLGPVQALEVFDPLVAEIEAVLEHRRALAAARTLGLHHVADQISKLPTEIRDQLTSHGKIESRLRRLEHLDPAACPAPPTNTASRSSKRSSPKTAQRAARSAASNVSSTTCSTATAPPCATNPASAPSPQPPCCARSATPHGSTARPNSPAGAAPAPSPCPQAKAAASPPSTGSTSEATGASTPCRTSRRSPRPAASPTPPPCLTRKTGQGKTPREARRAHKRHLANRVIRRMRRDEKHRQQARHHAA